MYAELLLQIWENLVGVLQLSIPPIWVLKGIYLILGMYAGLLLQIWENLVGVWQSCILINLG